MGPIPWTLHMKFGFSRPGLPVVSKEKMFKECGQRTDRQRPTVQVKKNPHFLFFSVINCLFFWEKLGEIVENFSRFLQEIQYFLQEIPVFLPEIL